MRLDTPILQDLIGDSGNTYDLEVTTFFDDRRKKTLRVILTINPWFGRGTIPKELTTDFIIAPDGSFVGE